MGLKHLKGMAFLLFFVAGLAQGGKSSSASSLSLAGSPDRNSAEDNEPASSGSQTVQHKYDKSDKFSSGGGGGANDKFSSVYPSSAYSYYGTYGYPGGNYQPYGYTNSHNPHFNPYLTEPLMYDRNGKDFSTRTSNHMPMAASSNYGNFGNGPSPSVQHSKEVTGPEYGGMASASGGQGWGWSKGGGGGGGGWGKGGNLDTSALGLLGLIGLFSLLQNVLAMLTTTTTTTMMMMMMTRRKRRDMSGQDVTDDAPAEIIEEGNQRASRISMMVLPSLNVIAHAREGRVPLDCTHREVCVANHLLVKELGVQGRSVGSMISTAITKFLKEADHSEAIGKHLTKASLAGRNGQDCAELYPYCEALKPGGAASLPMLMGPHHIADITRINQLKRDSSQSPKPNAL